MDLTRPIGIGRREVVASAVYALALAAAGCGYERNGNGPEPRTFCNF